MLPVTRAFFLLLTGPWRVCSCIQRSYGLCPEEWLNPNGPRSCTPDALSAFPNIPACLYVCAHTRFRRRIVWTLSLRFVHHFCFFASFVCPAVFHIPMCEHAWAGGSWHGHGPHWRQERKNHICRAKHCTGKTSECGNSRVLSIACSIGLWVPFKVKVYSIYESHSFIWFQSNSVERHGRIQVGDTITHIDGTPISVGPRSIPIINSKDKPEHFSTNIYIYIYIYYHRIFRTWLLTRSRTWSSESAVICILKHHARKKCNMFDL